MDGDGGANLPTSAYIALVVGIVALVLFLALASTVQPIP